MKDLIEYIARTLVDCPESVEVREVGSPSCLELRVAQEDLGRIIGRKGSTARAMRALLYAVAGGEGSCELEICGHEETAAE